MTPGVVGAVEKVTESITDMGGELGEVAGGA